MAGKRVFFSKGTIIDTQEANYYQSHSEPTLKERKDTVEIASANANRKDFHFINCF